MKTSHPTSELKATFRQEVLSFLWRQWTQMGVSGTAAGTDDWAIDPESLLAYSLCACRREPRLFDEILDWLVHNAGLVSVQRLLNRATAGDERILRTALAWAGQHGAAPFRARRDDEMAVDPAEPLFVVDGVALHVERPDPVFLRFGLLRPEVSPSGKSRPLDPLVPANLAFRIRHLFGLGTRAEAVRLLLTTGARLSTSEVAEAASYARRNVEDAMAALAEAGVIAGVRQAGRRTWWLDQERWAALLNIDALDLPRFVDWERLFNVMRKLDEWFERDAREKRSDYMRASTARESLDGIRDDLVSVGLEAPSRVEAKRALTALEDVTISVLGFLAAEDETSSS